MCHGKTEVFPDKDGSDPYAVSAFVSVQQSLRLYCIYMLRVLFEISSRSKYAVGPQSDSN